MRKTGIKYLDNIIINEELLMWKEVCNLYGRSSKGHKSHWYIKIENILIENENVSRKVGVFRYC